MFDAPLTDDPYIALRRKLAADRKAALDRKRMADDAVLPLVIQDHKDSLARTDAINQRVDMALSSLSGPPPQMGAPQMNEGEVITAALTQMFAPNNMGHVMQALQGASTARNEREFDNALRAYGLDREQAKMGLQMLMGQLDREEGKQDHLRSTELNIRNQNAKSTEEIHQFYDDAERDLEAMSTTYGLNLEKERKEIEAKRQAELKQAGKDLRTNLEQSISSFNTKVQQARGAYQGTLPPELETAYKAERAQLEADIRNSGQSGLPGLDAIVNAPTAAATTSNRNFEQSVRQFELTHADKIAGKNPDGSYIFKPPPPKTTERQKEFGKLQSAVDKAKADVRSAFNKRSTKAGSDEDLNSKLAAVQKEWEAVAEKRGFSGGRVEGFEQYLQDTYPDFYNEIAFRDFSNNPTGGLVTPFNPPILKGNIGYGPGQNRPPNTAAPSKKTNTVQVEGVGEVTYKRKP